MYFLICLYRSESNKVYVRSFVQELAFKDFSIFSSCGHLVYRSGTILAILVGNQLSIIPVKFELHWPNGLGDSI